MLCPLVACPRVPGCRSLSPSPPPLLGYRWWGPAADGRVQALDKRQAHLCVLAASCNEPNYTKLVEALCREHGINLIKVPDSKQLGEWVGLCKFDKEAKPRKVVSCSCVVVKDYGEESEALNVLLNYFKTRA